jgi:hypothetical protein
LYNNVCRVSRLKLWQKITKHLRYCSSQVEEVSRKKDIRYPKWIVSCKSFFPSCRVQSKDIVRPFEFAGMTRLIRSCIINWRPDKFFLNFNYKVSREEHLNIYSSLRFLGWPCPIKVSYQRWSLVGCWGFHQIPF